MTVNDFAVKWLGIKKYTLSPLSYDNYERTINNLLVPFFDNVELSELTPLDIQHFIGYLLDKYTPVTARRKFAVVRCFFHKAYTYGYCEDLMRGGVDLPRVVKKKIKYYNKAEIEVILNAVSSLPLAWRCLFILLLDIGARRGEVLALTWEDIDLNTGKIYLGKAVYRLKGEEFIKSTKGGKDRVVYASAYCTNLLKEYRKECKEDRLFKWRPDYVTHKFTDLCEENGIDGHLHCLRHTCATSMLRSGVDVQTVKDRLGHSSLNTTAIYLHSDDSADKEAAQKLGSYFYSK